jgi:hypothetical protein
VSSFWRQFSGEEEELIVNVSTEAEKFVKIHETVKT